MRLDDEIKLAQDVFGALGTFDVNSSRRMTELNLHASIIGCQTDQEQGESEL